MTTTVIAGGVESILADLPRSGRKPRIDAAEIVRVTTQTKNMQYLYEDGADLVLMDNETYEQFNFPAAGVESRDLLAPNAEVQVLFVRDAPFRVELPIAVELAVVRTDPGAKGDTVSNVTKPAELETGATVNVDGGSDFI